MQTMMREQTLETRKISPVVLRSTLFNTGTTWPQGYRLEPRSVYDYELEYYLYSTGAMHINGTDWPLGKGDVCFRRPGEWVAGIMPYNCILICFDMLGDTDKNPVTYDFNREQSYQPLYRNPVLDAIPSVLHPQSEGIRALFETILRLYLSGGDAATLQMKGCMLHLLNRLYQESCIPLHTDTGIRPAHADLIRDALAYVRDHLGESLSLDVLASRAGMSPAHFHKMFSAAVKEPLNVHVTKMRMEKARECLVQTDWPVYRVASSCGYANPSHFGWLFRKWVGMSPGEYKYRHRYA